MKKEQFADRHQGFSKEEIDRKWKAYIYEREEQDRLQKFLFEQVQAANARLASGSPGAYGAGGGKPVNNTQTGETVIELLRVADGTWKYVLFSVDSGTLSDVVDTTMPSTYSVWQLAVIQNKGYAIVFHNDDDDTLYAVLVKTNGALLVSVPLGVSNQVGYNYGDGRSFSITNTNDGAAKVLIYDGDVKFAVFDYADVSSVNFNSAYDYATINGLVGLDVEDMDGNIVTKVISYDGTTFDVYTHESSTQLYCQLYSYSFGDFMVAGIYDDNTGYWQTLKFYGEDGTLKSTVDTTNLDYQNTDLNFYGLNKMQVILYTGSTDDDYRIINFDGTTLVDTTESRGIYDQFDTQMDNLYPSNMMDYMPESVINVFYNSSGGTWIDPFVYYTDSKILSKVGSDPYRQYALPSGTGLSFAFTAETYCGGVFDLDGSINLLQIDGAGTVTLTEFTTRSEINNYINYEVFANNIEVDYTPQPDNNSRVYNVYGPAGTLRTTLTVPTPNYSYTITSYGLLIVRQYNGDDSFWYVNDTVTEFVHVDISHPESTNDYDPFFASPNGLSTGTVLLFNQSSSEPQVAVFKSGGPVHIVDLAVPVTGTPSVAVQKDQFIVQYLNTDGITLRLYDTGTGEILTSVDTTIQDSTWLASADKRFFPEYETMDGITTVFLTPTSIIEFSSAGYNYVWIMPNDYAWWND